jgi:hypothetical protein
MHSLPQFCDRKHNPLKWLLGFSHNLACIPIISAQNCRRDQATKKTPKKKN